ncbi:hypothetical protein NDI45_02035 [Leptolyngbya sp. GB1-A1]|uniref:hypothetical protein n=1 Tax=Leptolyngbya sp. GB1-A1 TaxID=2933908 RepID=UPI00329744EC
MSKLGCTCGHIICDQSDSLPYKGRVLKDQDHEAVLEGIASDVASYIKSLLGKDKGEWIAQSPWLQGKENGAVIWDIMIQYCLKYPVALYECENCGRLWVQKGVKSQDFVSYVPENPEIRAVLQSERHNRVE